MNGLTVTCVPTLRTLYPRLRKFYLSHCTRSERESELTMTRTCEAQCSAENRRRKSEQGKANVVVRLGSEDFNLRLLPLMKESLYFVRRVDKLLTSLDGKGGPSSVVTYAPPTVRVGSQDFDLQLLPILKENLYFMNVVDRMFTSLAERDGTPLVIHMPEDSPCNPDSFRTVINFCYGRMEESELSHGNVVKLIVTSQFLEMENFTRRASEFLEESALSTWGGCLSVLSSFDYASLLKAGTKNVPNGESMASTRFEDEDEKNNESFAEDEDVKCDQGSEEDDQSSEEEEDEEDDQSSEEEEDEEDDQSSEEDEDEESDRGFETDEDEEDEDEESDQRFEEGYFSPGDEESDQRFEEGYFSRGDFSNSVLEFELFEKSKMALVDKLERFDHKPSQKHYISQMCNLSWLVRIAERLPLEATEAIFESILFSQYGLFYMHNNTRFDLCLHYPKLNLSTSVGSCIHNSSHKDVIVGLMDEIRTSVKDVSKRALLVAYIVKLILPDEHIIRNSVSVCIYFLCALLAEVEATELVAKLQEGPAQDFQKRNIPWMHRMIRTTVKFCSTEALCAELVSLLADFNFSTLLSIAQLLELSYNDSAKLAVKIFDTCLANHLKDKSLTVQQILEFYSSVPNDKRPSHVEIYQVFEDSIREKALTPEEMDKLSNIFDYDKLTDNVVQRLWGEFGFGFNERRLHERVVKLQKMKETKTKDELLVLGRELKLAKSEVHKSKLQLTKEKEKNKSVSELESKLQVARNDIEKEKEKAKKDIEKQEEKVACRICFVRPRDAVLLPCLHFHYCSECLEEHARRIKTCPTCRGPTHATLKCIL